MSLYVFELDFELQNTPKREQVLCAECKADFAI